MKATIEGNELVIRLPLQAPELSSTGKTWAVATTSGNRPTDARVKGPDGKDYPIIIGVNAYIKAPVPKQELATA